MHGLRHTPRLREDAVRLGRQFRLKERSRTRALEVEDGLVGVADKHYALEVVRPASNERELER